MKLHLSVIIPMYNESKNLERGVLDEVEKYLNDQKYTSEVIISDDESTDNSLSHVNKYVNKNPRFHLVRNKHGGKPFALKSGLEHALGEIVLFTDMDQSTPIKEIAKLLPFFEQKYDVVIGSRGVSRKNFPWYRQLTSWGFRTFRRSFLLSNLIDTQCGFKAFKCKAANQIFAKMSIFHNTPIQIKGWRVSAYDVEALFLAEKFGYRIKEVPVMWQDEDISTGKKRNFYKESKEMLKEIFRVKLNALKGIY